MAADIDMTRVIDGCRIDVSPAEVDAGADITLTGRVSCSPPGDLRGKTLLIKDPDGALAEHIELTEFDGETNQTLPFVLKAPRDPGAYTWLAVYPADATPGLSHEETASPFSFTVRPHSTRVLVWDVPSAIERGKRFSIRFGARCSSGCGPRGRALEVCDHDGKKLASVTLSDEVWPETAALYCGEAELTAPETEGLYQWEVRAPAASLETPHAGGVAGFSVRVVPTPECVLTVVAIDMETQTPVEGARVVVHPYRAVTNDRGMAELRVPTGAYRIFVSGSNYFPFRDDRDIRTDTTIRAELTLDQELSDADAWS